MEIIGHIFGQVLMVKQQGKTRQWNIFESVAANLKNLMGGVDMCVELMAAPFPSQGNNSVGFRSTVQQDTDKNETVKKALLKFHASQSHFITTHRFTKIVHFPFCKSFFFGLR